MFRSSARPPPLFLMFYAAGGALTTFGGGGLISAILRRQSASESCGPETNVPLTFVLYQPETTPSRSDSSVLTWRGERFCMYLLSGERSKNLRREGFRLILRATVRSTLAREPGKIRKYRRNHITMMSVVRRQASCVQIQDVARLGGGLRPRRGGNREKLLFQKGLPVAQILCVVLNLRQSPPDVSRSLSGHATVLVEIERLLSHWARLRRSAAHPTDRPSRWKSSPSSNRA